MNERIKALYQSHILTKSKDESHVGKLADATHILEAYNPMCGDKYSVYLKMDADRIIDARFEGYGCAISKASTAVLTEKVIGQNIEELKPIIESFLELIDADSNQAPETLSSEDQLLAFAAAREFPERRSCASLSWEELREML